MVPEGLARAGDTLMTPWGEYREVEWVKSAGVWWREYTDRNVAPRLILRTSTGLGHAITRYGASTNRDRERREHERRRLNRPVRPAPKGL